MSTAAPGAGSASASSNRSASTASAAPPARNASRGGWSRCSRRFSPRRVARASWARFERLRDAPGRRRPDGVDGRIGGRVQRLERCRDYERGGRAFLRHGGATFRQSGRSNYERQRLRGNVAARPLPGKSIEHLLNAGLHDGQAVRAHLDFAIVPIRHGAAVLVSIEAV